MHLVMDVRMCRLMAWALWVNCILVTAVLCTYVRRVPSFLAVDYAGFFVLN